MPEICDYEGTDYRRFWEEGRRQYEDAAERIALHRLLPPRGERLIEIGVGFGRLAEFYTGYREVVLLDYARSPLAQARAKLAPDPRLRFVAADLHHLPFAPASFDTALTVRVLHHVRELPPAFAQVQRILRAQGVYVLEYANKRNLKEMLRYFSLRPHRGPFSLETVEPNPLHFNFHPFYVASCLVAAGFEVEAELSVSLFRLALLKRLFSARVLGALDGLLQSPTAPLKLGPSIFLRTRSLLSKPDVTPSAFWQCPLCGSTDLQEEEAGLLCRGCAAAWPKLDGIYDFTGRPL